ncbi:MAG TPA: hypothetical protein VK010_00995 [Flavobacteriaceae bacterium]|nr:hypothetical protein [Flavobacteriaceae bacterium]
MLKKGFLFFAVISVLWSCSEEKQVFSGLMGFIPPETGLVLKTDNLKELGEDFSENSFFNQHKFPAFSELEERISIFSQLNPKDESLLCASLIGRDLLFTYITENHSDIFPADSTIFRNNGEYVYDHQHIGKHFLQQVELFSVVLGGTLVISDSKLIVESIVRSFNLGLGKDPQLQKVYDVSSGNASIFVHHKDFEGFYRYFFPNGKSPFLENLANWTVMDLEVKKNGIFLNGVVVSEDEIPKKIDLFKKVQPQKNRIAQIVPLNSKGFFSFTYHDFHVLRENIRLYRKVDALPKLSLEKLFLTVDEIGIIYNELGETVVLASKKSEETKEALLAHTSVVKEFRGVRIYNFSEKSIFKDAFSPLVSIPDLEFYAQIDNFFMFSNKLEVLENNIANHQNNSVLGQQAYFEELKKNLSDESSILLVGLNANLKNDLAAKAKSEYQSEIKKIDFNKYKTSALQFIHSEGFAHVNAVFLEAGENSETKGAVQLMALDLENPLAGSPQFFEYWRTGEQYIVAQDEKNILYLFDKQGDLKWKKELDGRILGKIKEVDLFKNKRLQMAFATPGGFYVIDRLGKDVSPFPVEFKNLTQPLSVFDYAGNRDYRFVIVQGEKIRMLDSQAKEVRGFEFNKTNSEVLQPANHIRIGKKDYILIPEASGKLNILSRQGSQRVKAEKEIKFSENSWYLYKGKFTSTNADGDLVQVDEKGNISTKDLKLSENHHIVATPELLVMVSENTLTIGEKEIELDYGLYSKPEIFETGGKTYISLTDTQVGKVYLFNKKGELLPGFPVYGNSTIDLDNLDDEGKLEFVVKGEENRVLVYRLE